MTARSVETIFTAKVDGYLAGVTRMKMATTDMAKAGAASMKAHSTDWDKIGKAATIGGLAIGAAVAFSAKAYMDFEASMSKVAAVANATAKEQKALGAAALQAGQDTVFSAMQAAEAEAELLKAGISVSDVLGGALTGSLDLAAAGQIGLAQSAEIAAQAMNIFNLEGADVGHIADVLTAGANKSAAGVDDLGMALQQGGLVAKQTGLTLEETVGTLSAFADNALKGSDAGTSMKTMLQRLNPTTTEAKTLMEELNLSAYDSQGNFVGLAEYAGQLQGALSGMTAEQRNATLATLFGSDAVRGANVLYEQGEAGMRKYIAAVDDQGAASRMAAKMTGNLKGDIDDLRGSLEAAFINGGSGANEGLRELVQLLDSAVGAFNDLSPAQQSYIVKAAAVTAGVLLLGAGVIKAVAAVQSLKAAYAATGIAGTQFATTTGAATKGVAKLAAAFAVLAVASQFGGSGDFGVNALAKDLRAAEDPLKAINAELARTAVVANGSDYQIRNVGDALKEAFDPGAFNGVQKVIGGIANAFGGDFKTDSEFAAIQLDRVGQSLAKLVQDGNADQAASAFAEIAAQAKAQGISTEDLLRKMPAYQDALDNAAVAAASAGSAAGDFAAETYAASKAAQAASTGTDVWAEELEQVNSPLLTARDAARQFEQAVDDASAALKENGKSLDIGTEKGRKNQAALDGVASAAISQISAMQANGASQRDLQSTLDASRARLVTVAEKFGMSRSQARAYADQVLKTPKAVSTTITAKTEAAKAAVAALQSKINGIQGKSVLITVRYNTVNRPNGGRDLQGGLIQADGGMNINRGGRLVTAYSDGGTFDGSFAGAQPQIAKAGGRGVLWREEGAGPWEAFISGHPAKKGRSRGIAEDTVDRLGGAITWVKPMADGGTMTRSWADQVRHLGPRASSGAGGVSVTNLNVRVDGALDPVAVGAQVERVLQQYTSVTGRPLQVSVSR